MHIFSRKDILVRETLLKPFNTMQASLFPELELSLPELGQGLQTELTSKEKEFVEVCRACRLEEHVPERHQWTGMRQRYVGRISRPPGFFQNGRICSKNGRSGSLLFCVFRGECPGKGKVLHAGRTAVGTGNWAWFRSGLQMAAWMTRQTRLPAAWKAARCRFHNNSAET